MTIYRDINSGEEYTLEELRKTFEQFKDEQSFESFEDYLDHYLSLGRQRIEGYEEIER